MIFVYTLSGSQGTGSWRERKNKVTRVPESRGPAFLFRFREIFSGGWKGWKGQKVWKGQNAREFGSKEN
jgi:hypothetical protein